MDVLFIITGLGLLGHRLNMNGKTPRETNSTFQVPENEKPGSTHIYNQIWLDKVRKDELELAKKKYDKHIQEQYGGPGGDNIFPSSTIETFVGVDCEQDIKGLCAVDPGTGSFVVSNKDITQGPMFDNPLGGVDDADNSPPVPLDGLEPSGLVHANMQPNFSTRNQKSVGIESANTLVQLEKFTGVSSSQGTWYPKQVVDQRINGPQRSDRQLSITQLQDVDDRTAGFFRGQSQSQNDWKLPQPQIRHQIVNFDTKRILPKPFEETQSVQRPRTHAQGRPNVGKSFGMRPIAPNVVRYNNELPAEAREALPSRNKSTAPVKNGILQIKSSRATNMDMERNYVAPGRYDTQGAYGNTAETLGENYSQMVRRKNDTIDGQFGIVGGHMAGHTQGAERYILQVAEEKNKTKDYMVAGSDGRGHASRNIAPKDIDATWKDVIDVSQHSGRMNPVGNADGAYKVIKPELEVTQREMNSENKYIGHGHKNLGNGMRSSRIQPWTTVKEMLVEHNYKPVPKGVTKHEKRDAEYNVYRDKAVDGRMTSGVSYTAQEGLEFEFKERDSVFNGEQQAQQSAGRNGGYLNSQRLNSLYEIKDQIPEVPNSRFDDLVHTIPERSFDLMAPELIQRPR